MFADQTNNWVNTKNKEATKNYLELYKLEIFPGICCDDQIRA